MKTASNKNWSQKKTLSPISYSATFEKRIKLQAITNLQGSKHDAQSHILNMWHKCITNRSISILKLNPSLQTLTTTMIKIGDNLKTERFEQNPIT